MATEKIEVNDLVFARVKGFKAWPARVIEPKDGGKFTVFFYGTYQTGRVMEKDMWLFNAETKQKFGTGKNKTFIKALKEIENNPDISKEDLRFAKEDSEKNVDDQGTPKKKSGRPSHRKMYVQIKNTNEIIEIDVDKNRPKNFPTRQLADEWERENMRQVLKFIKLVEEGKFVPEEVIERIDKKKKKTEDEQAFVDKWQVLSKDRRHKIQWLETEIKLVNFDLELKQILAALPASEDAPKKPPNLNRVLEIQKEILKLEVSPLMLKKQPQVVKTMFNLCAYDVSHEFKELKEAITVLRTTANEIMLKFEGCFECPQDALFNEFFKNQVHEFQEKIKKLPSEQVSFMTNEDLII